MTGGLAQKYRAAKTQARHWLRDGMEPDVVADRLGVRLSTVVRWADDNGKSSFPIEIDPKFRKVSYYKPKPRTFKPKPPRPEKRYDHAEALRLMEVENLSYNVLSKKYGVSVTTLAQLWKAAHPDQKRKAGTHKVDHAEVIRLLDANEATGMELAARYGVTHQAISLIWRKARPDAVQRRAKPKYDYLGAAKRLVADKCVDLGELSKKTGIPAPTLHVVLKKDYVDYYNAWKAERDATWSAIVQDYKDGMICRELSKKYGKKVNTISRHIREHHPGVMRAGGFAYAKTLREKAG